MGSVSTLHYPGAHAFNARFRWFRYRQQGEGIGPGGEHQPYFTVNTPIHTNCRPIDV